MSNRRFQTALVIGTLLLCTTSCGQDSATGDPAADGQTDQTRGGEPSEFEGKSVDLPYLANPSDESVRPEAAFSGTLRADPDMDGGCVWLEAGDGRVLPLVWMDEMRVRFREGGPAQIEDSEGTVYANEGDTVELAGGSAPEPERCGLGEDHFAWVYFPG